MCPRACTRLRLPTLAGAILLLGFGSSPAQAQRGLRPTTYRPEPRVHLSAMATYQWGGTINTTQGQLQLEDSENFAGVLAFRVRPGAMGELYYGYQPTTLSRELPGGIQEPLVPMNVHYFQLGGRYEPIRQGGLMPFFVGSAGAVLFDPGRSSAGIEYSSNWEFAFRFALGATAMLTPRFGLRGEVGMLLPVFWSGGGFMCGGAGCYGTVTGTSTVVQGTAGGGLTIAF
jgi:hypothetical protein